MTISDDMIKLAAFADACAGMGQAIDDATRSLKLFVSTYHDVMNAAATAHVLRRMGRSDLAIWFEPGPPASGSG